MPFPRISLIKHGHSTAFCCIPRTVSVFEVCGKGGKWNGNGLGLVYVGGRGVGKWSWSVMVRGRRRDGGKWIWHDLRGFFLCWGFGFWRMSYSACCGKGERERSSQDRWFRKIHDGRDMRNKSLFWCFAKIWKMPLVITTPSYYRDIIARPRFWQDDSSWCLAGTANLGR